MTIYTAKELHINNQITLNPVENNQELRDKTLNFTQHQFDRFNPDIKDYLNRNKTKQSREAIIDWIKKNHPVAAITMVFNCAITHRDSVDLLNRFYDCFCKYQYGRTYKKRNELVSMFAFLENAVKDRNKSHHLKYEDCNHYHLILCDPTGIFKDHTSIAVDISSARKKANNNFRKSFRAQIPDTSHLPQIARCQVLKYFNNGDDGWENYITKNLENHNRTYDLKFDQIAYPSINGFIFGERIYN